MSSSRPESPLISASGELPARILANDEMALMIGLRFQGCTTREIAARVGCTLDQVRQRLALARQRGQLRDTLEVLDNVAVPAAVDNLITALNDPKDANHWRATEKTLDGRGAFRKFSNRDQTGAGVGGAQALPPLQINIITPNGDAMPTVIVNSEQGSVVGTPRSDEGS